LPPIADQRPAAFGTEVFFGGEGTGTVKIEDESRLARQFGKQGDPLTALGTIFEMGDFCRRESPAVAY
jgi:hypothetical protein